MNKRQFKLYRLVRLVYRYVIGLPPNVFVDDLDHIHIGEHVRLGPGVCIISGNHDPLDPGSSLPREDVTIGDYSWLGANVVITPGVTLGPHTTVGAGAVVTKSFPEGNVILVGVPAHVLRHLPDAQSSQT